MQFAGITGYYNNYGALSYSTLGSHTFNAGNTLSGGGHYIVTGDWEGGVPINGTVIVNSGTTLELSSGYITGTNTFAGAGTISWTGSTIQETTTIDNGTTLNWVQGVIGDGWGAGQYSQHILNIAPTAHVNISGSGYKSMNGTLNNAGNIVWVDSGSIIASGTFNNSGTFDVQGDAQIQAAQWYSSYVPFDFNNTGIFTKSGGTGTASLGLGVGRTYGYVNFSNDGTVNVNTGTLYIGGGGSSAGNFNTASGAALYCGGSFTGNLNASNSSVINILSGSINTGATVTGLCELVGDVTLEGMVVINGTLEVVGGSLYGSTTGTFTGRGTFNIVSGYLDGIITIPPNGPNAPTFNWVGGDVIGILNIAAGAQLNISGSSDKSVYGGNYNTGGGTVNNDGTVNWSGSGNIILGRYQDTYHLGGRGVVNNRGSFVVQNDARLYGGIDSQVFNNSGDFVKSDSTGITHFVNAPLPNIATYYVTFKNSGNVNVNSGTLDAPYYDQLDGVTCLAGGNLSAWLYIEGGTLKGKGLIDGSVYNVGGIIRPGVDSMDNTGTLHITEDYSQDATGQIDIKIGRADTGELFDQVQVDGKATLNGTLHVSLVDGFTFSPPNSFQIIPYTSHTGIFATVIGNSSLPVSYASNGVFLGITPALTLSIDPFIFSEGAGANAATGTVTRNTSTTAALSVNLASSNTGKATVSSPLTIPAGAASATFPITAVDNNKVDGDQSVTITASAANFAAGAANMTVTDNDTAGIAVTPTTGLTTTEAGGTATFTVQLASQPTSNVVIGLSSTNAAEGTVAPASLTFTPANWNTPQTVTVTGVDDAVHDGDITYKVILAPATSADANYDKLKASDVTLVNKDNDVAGVTVTPTAGLVTTQAGGTATFTVRLNSQPTANVTLPLTSSNPAQGTPSAAALTFTPLNWNSAQTVTVTGVNNNVAGADVAYAIITGAPASADAVYAALQASDIPDVQVTNKNNNSAGLTLTPTSGLLTSKAGGSATFTATLTSQPVANVTVSLTSSNTGEGTPSPAALAFTPANWNVAQSVTVTGVDNGLAEGNQAYTIAAAVSSADPLYAALQTATVAVTNVDNHQPTLTLGLNPTTFGESAGATAATGTLTRNTPTSAALTVNLVSSNPAKATVPATVTIPAGQTTATFPVAAVDNAIADGNQPVTITASVLGLNPGAASVTVTDDDTPSLTLSVTPTTFAKTAGATAATGTVTRNTPTGDALTVSLASNGNAATVPATVTIPAGAASTTFAIGAVDDKVVDGSHQATLTASAPGLASGTATVTVTDSDTAPTFSLGGHITLGTGGLGGVTVQLLAGNAPAGTAITDATGGYLFKNLDAGAYTIQVTKTNYTFTPASRPVTLSANVTNADFSAAPHFTISGHLSQSVKGKTQPLAGAVVYARGGALVIATRSNSQGAYVFDNPALTAGTYFIAPGMAGTYFAPRSRNVTLTALAPAATGADFSVVGKDAIKPSVKITTPQTSQILTALTTTKGTASDSGGAGLGFITVAIARYASAKATAPSSYWNWNKNTWINAADPAAVEKLAVGTANWSLTGLPKLPPGFYGLRATAVDNAANRAQSAWTRLSVSKVTAKPTPPPSPVKLSTGTASAATSSAQLKFLGALDAETAGDASHYAVTVNGHTVVVESAGYNSTIHVVTLGLAEGSLKAGDRVLIQWHDLKDSDGLALASQVGLAVGR